MRDQTVRILAFTSLLAAVGLAGWFIGGLIGFLVGILAGFVVHALYGLDITYGLAFYGGFVGGVILAIGIPAITLYRSVRRAPRSN